MSRSIVNTGLGVLVCLCAGAAFGQPDPPAVTDPEWFNWYQNLLQTRMAACPLARGHTYCFSQAGNDLTGDGSVANPWKTIAKAGQVLLSSAGDVALLFRRGDVWREQVGINTSVPNITIADYGTGDKPLFTAFQSVGSSGAWSPVVGLPNTYRRPDSNPVTWVKEDDDLDRPYSRQGTPLQVDQNEGSWYWDGAAYLYIHPRHSGGVATDPRSDGKSYELVRPTLSGVRVYGNGTRVQNIRTEGWGVSIQPGTQCHGIDCRVAGSDQAVFVGCESHYGLAHTMTLFVEGYGGIATFVGCSAGLTTPSAGGGETMFNTYATDGGNQTIFDHCTATHGTLQSSSLPPGRYGIGFYGHTDAETGHYLGLTISYGCTTRDTLVGCVTSGNFSNLTPADRLQDVRCFFVDELFEGGAGTGYLFQIGAENAARVNSRYVGLHPGPLFASALASWNAMGWVINCTVDVDGSDQPGEFSMFLSSFTPPSRVQLWNCYFGVHTRPGQVFRFDGAVPLNSEGTSVVNCAIVNTGGGICRPNLSPPSPLHSVRGETPSAFRSCAYFGVDSATSAADAHPVVLGAPEPASALLSCVSPFACAGGPLPGAIILGYDQRGATGVRNDIGPVEAFVCANCDQSTAEPVLNIQDYMCFVNKFAAGDPGANCDGSTSPPVLNVADFLCFQTAFARGCR